MGETNKKIRSRCNPNGANQYKVDPRQSLFLQYYLDPKSETFSNALRSAIKAGYSDEYSQVITDQLPRWLSDNLGDHVLIKKATDNVKELLEQGEDIKVKNDMTKFVLSRLDKKKWSERKELSGVDGEPLFSKEDKAKTKTILDNVFQSTQDFLKK